MMYASLRPPVLRHHLIRLPLCSMIRRKVEVFTPKAFSFEPMLCEGVERPPEGRQWRYELKLDGYRAIGRKSGRSAQLWSRNQKNFTRRFPAVAKALAEIPSDTIIDGEIVALDENAKPSLDLLQGFRPGRGVDRALRLRSTHVARQGRPSLAARRTSRASSTNCGTATGRNPML
jgi:ATP-dependent DNA ligase